MKVVPRVRLDKWLWAARLFKTRTAAAEAIEAGRVRARGERLKPARELRVGEELEIAQRDGRVDVIVQSLSTMRGPAAAARQLYAETEESIERRSRVREAVRHRAEPADTLKGRPSKRDARRLRRLRESAGD